MLFVSLINVTFFVPAHCLNKPCFVFLHVFCYAVCSVLNKYVMCIVVFIIWENFLQFYQYL